MSTGYKNLNFLLLYLEDTLLVPSGYHNKKFLKSLLQQFLCQVKPSGYGIPKITSPRPWGPAYFGNASTLGLAKPYTLIMYMV
jgi:hypothetical protein